MVGLAVIVGLAVTVTGDWEWMVDLEAGVAFLVALALGLSSSAVAFKCETALLTSLGETCLEFFFKVTAFFPFAPTVFAAAFVAVVRALVFFAVFRVETLFVTNIDSPKYRSIFTSVDCRSITWLAAAGYWKTLPTDPSKTPPSQV